MGGQSKDHRLPGAKMVEAYIRKESGPLDLEYKSWNFGQKLN